MSFTLPELRVGDPLRQDSLSIFPIFLAEATQDVSYCLTESALADATLLVEEISERGSVPNLSVENKGDQRVLFLEGEELVGAKQNRILNTSVLVAAHAKVQIPVSCVEQGRWRYKGHSFQSGGSHSPSKLRRRLKSSVHLALKRDGSHCSDQGEVWSEIRSVSDSHGVASPTGAMADTYAAYDRQIRELQSTFDYVPGAAGVAVAIGERVLSVDVFDKPSTCEQVWGRLIKGVFFEAVESPKAENLATTEAVETFVADARALEWQKANAVGEGQEFRAESKKGEQGSALMLADTMVHGSVVAAV